MPGRAGPFRNESKAERLIRSPESNEAAASDMPVDGRAHDADHEEALFPTRRIPGTPSACRKLCVTASVMMALLSIFVLAVVYLQNAF
eukprot:m.430916 g.430916  ORF g.430916 m.430916 type:complete len:88 (-) comp17228_c0_seq1:1164-1427(-)